MQKFKHTNFNQLKLTEMVQYSMTILLKKLNKLRQLILFLYRIIMYEYAPTISIWDKRDQLFK